MADENIEPSIIEGLKRQLPSVDFVTVREVGLAAVDDRIILEWAAVNGRIVVTRDVDSMIGYARDRVRAGLSMPGMVVISSSRSFASIIGSVFNMDCLENGKDKYCMQGPIRLDSCAMLE